MFRQQPPTKINPPLTPHGIQVKKPPNNRRRHNPYEDDGGDHDPRNERTAYGVQNDNPGFTQNGIDTRPPVAVTRNPVMEWATPFCPNEGGEPVITSFGSAKNQWVPPRGAGMEHPTLMQDGWGQPNPPSDVSFPYQGDIYFTSPSITTGPLPSLPSKSVISPHHLGSHNTPWDPVVASIPYQGQISYDPPSNYPHAQLRGPEERSGHSSSRSARSKPLNNSNNSFQLGSSVYGPDHHTSFPPPYSSTPQAPVPAVITGGSSTEIFDNLQDLRQQPQVPAWSAHSNGFHYRGGEVAVDGDWVNRNGNQVHPVELGVHTVQPATAGQMWRSDHGRAPDVPNPSRDQRFPNSNSMIDLASTDTHSFSSVGPDPRMAVHPGSESQRAQSEESFFFKHNRPSQPPPVLAPRLASSSDIIDMSLIKFQQGANSRFEQNSAYAMLWPPPDILAQSGDLFVNTDSVTSGRRAWVSDGSTWTPIAYP